MTSNNDNSEPDTRRLDFEERKHRDELELRREELDIRRQEANPNVLHSPLVLALFAAVIGIFGNALVAWYNGLSERVLEDKKAEAARILEAIKTGDPDVAAENLEMLVDAGLVQDRAESIRAYLDSREPGQGARLPGIVESSRTERHRALRSLALADRQIDELRIHYFDVGAGACTIVECPQSGPLVIDCGSLDAVRDETRAAIRDVLDGHSEPPTVVLSHPDRDHYSLVPKILNDVQVADIWQGGQILDYKEELSEWVDEQRRGGAMVHQTFPRDFYNDGNLIGESLKCGVASTFILTANSGETRNDNSLILGIRYRDFGAIFAGDATGQSEAQAIENFRGALSTTVLLASAHGSRSHGSNSAEWAEATSPSVVVISAGTRYGHPRCEATHRFTDNLVTVPSHPMRCNESSQIRNDFASTRAEYLTEAIGTIVITTNGTSPLSIECEGLDGCAASIEHEPSTLGESTETM